MKILQFVDLLRYNFITIEVEDSLEDEIQAGDKIILQTDRDYIVGKVLGGVRKLPNASVDKSYKFLRKFDLSEDQNFSLLLDKEKDRVRIAQKAADKLGLQMNFFASKNDLKGNIFSFFFVSEDKIDFRELLKVLPRDIRGRIHLQRVGPRDKARIIGGMGICGRKVCCVSFKKSLDTVPLNSARDQNLMIKNNSKLFGLCGKLKCCLLYEVSHYREKRKFLPHLKQMVKLVDGRQGQVIGLDILNQKVRIVFSEAQDTQVVDVADLELNKKPRVLQNAKTLKS